MTTYCVLVHPQAPIVELHAESVDPKSTKNFVVFQFADGTTLAAFILSNEGSGWWIKDASKVQQDSASVEVKRR